MSQLLGDDIRLMRLEPGEDSAPLICNLFRTRLSKQPTFDALSYVWGSRSIIRYIHIRSETISIGTRRLEITNNLHEALIRLRDVSEPRVLWVDAVCIDQSNFEERAQQVQLMRQIYSSASRVVVWLGPVERGTKIALKTIAVINEHVKAQGAVISSLKSITDQDPYQSILGLDKFEIEPDSFHALQQLFSREWFQRAWVIQEVDAGASRTQVLVGPHMIAWDDMGIAALWLRAMYWEDPSAPYSPDHWYGLQQNAVIMWQGSDRSTPAYLLDEIRRFQATDPRDRVYAFLGFPAFRQIITEFGFKPDYTQSVSDLYREVVILAIKSSQTLEILSYVDHPHHDLDLAYESALEGNQIASPSWVPRWDRPTAHKSFPLQDYDVHSQNTMGLCLTVTNTDRSSLLLEGFHVDKISDVGELIEWSPNGVGLHMQNPEALVKFWEIINCNRKFNIRAEDLVVRLAGAMTAGIDAKFACIAESLEQHVADFIAYLISSLDRVLQYQSHSSQMSEFQAQLKQLQERSYSNYQPRCLPEIPWTCAERKLFVTDNGLIGLGPSVTRDGDIVAILYGGYVPFVLRPRSGFHQLVGECYVQSTTHRKVLDRDDCQSNSQQVFMLR